MKRRHLLSALLGVMAAFDAFAAASKAPVTKPHPMPPALSPKTVEKSAAVGGLAPLGGASRAKGAAAIDGSARRH